MLQSGLSRELFEAWCGDANNGVIIADFAVQGTLAREILSDCKSIQSRSGGELPLKMSVDAISFSAHADYPQTQQFLDALAPPHVVLVHGEAGEMGTLMRALEGQAAADGKKRHVYSPTNCQAVEIKHSGSKTAKVLGALAENPPAAGDRVRGLLVRKDFGHMLVAPGDLPEYTKLATAAVTQRQMIPTETPLTDLRFALEAHCEGIHTVTSLRKESPEGSRGSPPASPKAKAKKAAKKASPRRAAARKGQGGGGEGRARGAGRGEGGGRRRGRRGGGARGTVRERRRADDREARRVR